MAKRKCSMPSDRLNGRAKKDYTKSGECVSTDTKASVSLEQFEKEDHYLQVARVRTYGQHFGWSAKVVAEKLGTTVENAEKILRRLDLAEEFSKKAALSPEAAAATANFSNEKEAAKPIPLDVFNLLSQKTRVQACLKYGEQYGWNASALACALGCTADHAARILRDLGLSGRYNDELAKTSPVEKTKQRLRRQEDTGLLDPYRSQAECEAARAKKKQSRMLQKKLWLLSGEEIKNRCILSV